MGPITSTKNGFSGMLNLISPGPYGDDIETLKVQVILQSQSIVRVKIYDPINPRWEVPNILKVPEPTSKPSEVDYNIDFNSKSFGFSIINLLTDEPQTIFNTTQPSDCSTNGLIFSDHYIELSTSFINPNPNIYGLGERTSSLRLSNNATYTLFAKDQGTASTPNINLYGAHPFYMELSPDGFAHGVFLLNSNAMDVVTKPNSLTYKVVGGILDFFILLGPTPLDVIQQYTSLIGTTHMPSYWSLGWHQCRWGYHTIQETESVVLNYSKFGIPLETMWNDIDYMDQYKDFTLDPVNFPQDQVAQLVDYLHSNNQHYMMIVDPGISIDDEYQSYQDLLDSGAFITQADQQTPVVGKVWPGNTIFPDFLNENSLDYWKTQLSNFREMVQFDGVWIDMNEISNFCNGDCTGDNQRMEGFDPNYPPYIPGGVPLFTNTLNMTSFQQNISIYDSHNLFGYSEGIATRLAAESLTGTRSTVISRSTYPGAGYHFGHWLGDNESTFADLYYSIPGILAMNMFGIPMVGADICGFNKNTTSELCARWLQLGNFYPFSRNHNSFNSIPQEPYVFGPQVTQIATTAINGKYTLLPFYYTLFFKSHVSGDPVWRPLFFEYPTDPNTWNLDTQFLVGESMLVSPVLTENATTVQAYFPNDLWYDYFTGVALASNGQQTLQAPLDTINVHLRAGYIIPTQPTSAYQQPVDGIPITTTIARTLPFNLIVPVSSQGSASGSLYLDDGISIGTYEAGQYSLVNFDLSSKSGVYTLESTIDTLGWKGIYDLSISTLTFYGIPSAPTVVLVKSSKTPFNYSSTTKVLTISNINLVLSNEFVVNIILG
eukprot:gene6215-7738_t